MVIEDSWGPAISDRETADFPKIKYPTKLLKCPKIVFFLEVTPISVTFPHILMQKPTFLFCALSSPMLGTWRPPKCAPTQNRPQPHSRAG